MQDAIQDEAFCLRDRCRWGHWQGEALHGCRAEPCIGKGEALQGSMPLVLTEFVLLLQHATGLHVWGSEVSGNGSNQSCMEGQVADKATAMSDRTPVPVRRRKEAAKLMMVTQGLNSEWNGKVDKVGLNLAMAEAKSGAGQSHASKRRSCINCRSNLATFKSSLARRGLAHSRRSRTSRTHRIHEWKE